MIAPGPVAEKAVAAYVAQTVPKERGVVIAAEQGGKTLFIYVRGLRDRGIPDGFDPNSFAFSRAGLDRAPLPRGAYPVTADTQFEIGSLTKAFTAMVIEQLIAAGNVDPNASIVTYLPTLSSLRSVHVVDLLHQQSGIADYNFFPDFRGPYDSFARTGSFDATLEHLNGEATHFASGSRYEYSNSNYLLLALIAERVTGESYERLLQKMIFGPLRLRSIGMRALGYSADGASGRAHQWDLRWTSGAGSIVLNAPEMLRWDAALLGDRAFSRATLVQFFAPSALTTSVGGRYAAGFILDSVAGKPLYWHNGAVGGFHAANFLFPSDDLAIVVLSNDQRTSAESIAMQTYGAFAGLDPNAVAATDGGWAVIRQQLLIGALILVAVIAIAITLAVVLYRRLRRRRQNSSPFGTTSA